MAQPTPSFEWSASAIRDAGAELFARLADRVRATPALELWTPCGLTIVCFRVRAAPGLPPDASDALNRRVLEAVQSSGQAFLSSTVLAGRFWLRACIVNPRTREADVDALLAAVMDAVDRVG
jgi:aromatic-L-amino-acid decarboxylase